MLKDGMVITTAMHCRPIRNVVQTMVDASTKDEFLDILILGNLFTVLELLISLSPAPSLSHNLFEPFDLNLSREDLVREFDDRLPCNHRLQCDVEIWGNKEDGAESSDPRLAADSMSDCVEFAARDDVGAPAAQDDCGTSGNGFPNTEIGWIFDLEAVSAVLKDDAECAVVTMGATAVFAGGTRSVGSVVTHAEVDIVGLVDGAEIDIDNGRESPEDGVQVVCGNGVEEL